MKKLALQIEHKFKNRVVGVHVIDGRRELTTLGSARTAHIRLLGSEVAGLHAAFECHDEKWSLLDLGSETGTWVNKQPVLEHVLEGATVIHIGPHQLKATPHVTERHLFQNESADAGKGEHVYHQVVVMNNGRLERSLLLKQEDAFEDLPAPKGPEWTITERGRLQIKQRLVRSDVVKENFDETFADNWRRPPLIAAVLTMVLIVGLMILMPHRPDDQLKTIPPDMQNQYTRMIFDGQHAREQKAMAERMRERLVSKTTKAASNAAAGRNGGHHSTPGAKVVMNLDKSGLGALIGKISARASKTAYLVHAAGVSPDSGKRSGTALALGGGSALDKLGGGLGGLGKTMHVGGIGTAGVGGGRHGFKGTGMLAQGNIGHAQVGVVDDETEIEGGLDKETIARVIRSQLGEIRYCYERQLSANPDLYGKILVKFTIGAMGSVVAQAIGTTSLNNAMVEGCILRRIAEWRFPHPKGGTKVLVSYPFLFKSTR